MAFFCSGSSSAMRFPGTSDSSNRGSYPNPLVPRRSRAMVPSQSPSPHRTSSPSSSRDTSTTVEWNRAVRSLSGTSFSCDKIFWLLASSLPCSPAQRADRIPGAPLRASTTRPESSATAMQKPVWSSAACAFISALSKNVSPSSTGSG